MKIKVILTSLITCSILVWGFAACVPQKKLLTSQNQTRVSDSLRRNMQDSLKLVKLERDKLQKDISILDKIIVQNDTKINLYEDSLQMIKEKVELLENDSTQITQMATLVDSLKRDNRILKDQFFRFQSKSRASNQKLKKQHTILEDSIKMLLEVRKKTALNPANIAWTIKRFNNSFDYYIVDLEKSKLELFWKTAEGDKYMSMRKLRNKLRQNKQNLIFATNAGMYTPTSDPQGLYIENRKKLAPLDSAKKGYGNFYMQPNGVFLVDTTHKAHVVTTPEFKKMEGKTLFATQSGPMLLTKGKMNPHFNKGSKNTYVRSGVGVISPTKLVFIISNRPVNFYDFATLFKENFGCKDALYLDGAISQMYLPELGRKELGGSFGAIIGVVK
jgi:uncharacterized protein YigE (DUF2233 family)